MSQGKTLTRDVALVQGESAILIIDLQKSCIDLSKRRAPGQDYFMDRVYDMVLPSLQKTLAVCRDRKMEVIYTYIECLTKDGRDQSLDYKISGFLVPKGSPDAAMLPEIAPHDDDILIPKTSCSVFNSTNIEYVLRNLGVKQLVVAGIVTNQCVESAVRDAADRGFLVTVLEDACATYTDGDHQQSLKNMKGFARIVSHEQIVKELQQW